MSRQVTPLIAITRSLSRDGTLQRCQLLHCRRASSRQHIHSHSPLHAAQPGSSVKRDGNTSNVNILPDLSNHMRQLMRSVPHPVVVVTASDPATSTDDTESAFRGMTISSFNTVTLSPRPYVSFNVKLPSVTHSALTTSGTFLVHLLSSSSLGVHIADAFAKGSNTRGEAFRSLVQEKRDGLEVQVFAGKGTEGAPLLASDGVLKVLRCRMLPGKEVTVEDHVVIVAEVAGILSPPKNQSRTNDQEPQARPEEQQLSLLYGNQGYRQWGRALAHDSPQTRAEASDENIHDTPIHRTIGLNVRRGDENTSDSR
ncbi:MAG: hypothetical protein M1828_007250 [Chrysothrix sp. TS-e1954]|nr:MAG: hypothetical protein M1828_007250 [Chrysothrix sp. TS-e1954]